MREHDLVVYGATGFTGQLVAEYLATRDGSYRVALAGRSRERLQAVADRLGVQWPILVADSGDDKALADMAASASVVITTVGPYARYGLPLVAACAAAGTHYVDLCGEVLFMRRTIDGFNDEARASGARIVHSCGFDSIPSDIGVWALHEQAGGELGSTVFGVRRAKGGFSGGTVASLLGQLEESEKDPDLRRLAADPYALSPDRSREPSPGDGPDQMGVRYDELLHSWTAPFVMAGINTRVVRRSNALSDYAYGQGFRYQEVVATGGGAPGRARATAVAAATGAGYLALSQSLTRGVLSRFLPSPGQGPDQETRESGGFTVSLRSLLPDGRLYGAEFAGHGDPGYAATSRMLAESAICLLETDGPGGVTTPAAAMGPELLRRLPEAGFSIRTWQVKEQG